METNKGENEIEEVNKSNKEGDEIKKEGNENNKEGDEIKKEKEKEENKEGNEIQKEEENSKEGSEIKKEEENKEGGEIKNKVEEENKEGGEIKKVEENNKEESEIKSKVEDNNKEGGEIKNKVEDNNNEGSEIKNKEEENNKEGDKIKKEEGEIKNKEEENNKEESEIKKEGNENNKEGSEIKKEGNENNKEEGEIKKEDEKNNKEGEIIKEVEENKEGGEIKKVEENKNEGEIKKEEENDKEKGEGIKKDKEENKEGEGIKKEEKNNCKEEDGIKKEFENTKEEENNKEENDNKKIVENNKDNENNKEEVNNKDDENNKEDEENEAKKGWFVVKVIGENIDTEKQSQLENEHSKIDQIIMENVCISEYLDKSPNFEKLKSFKAKNSKLQNFNLLKKMPELTELSIKFMPSLQIDFLEFLPKNIQKLYLEKNNFINLDFKNIFNFYISKNDIARNLQYLSFAGNNLTRIDLSSPKTKFESLIELDFRKNKICKIFINSESFPKLKFVNCCKNCLNRSYLNQLKNVISLESVNGYLLEPELCKPYYNKLKETLTNEDKVLFKMKYLNISHMPRAQSLDYFISFILVKNVTKYLKKLDLSYNKLNNETFFKFINKNQKFENLRTLNLNANDIDDTFFEEKNFQDKFCRLEHLYLNSNKIGDMKISIKYEDNIPIDDKYHNDKDKKLIYKLRAIYNFIELNKHLTKLTITKNPISEFYSVVPESNNDADKSDKYIKRDNNGMIIINCLFSLCIKIRDELLNQKDGRDTFNLRFDCRSNVNKNSFNYPYSDKPFIYKSKQ